MSACEFEVDFDAQRNVATLCGKPVVCELWFPGEPIPEARFCEQHQPEVRLI
jgi:hypothetical protein